MLTTTDKLIIAQAFALYKNEINKVRLYIACRARIPLNNISSLYANLIKESESHGYSDVVDYCLDQRYLKLKEVVKNYERKISKIDHKKLNYETDSEIEVKIFPIKPIKPRLDKIYQVENDKSYLIIRNNPLNQSSVTSTPKNVVDESKEHEINRPVKFSKRIFTRMNEEEKNIEDKLTEIEERSYYEEKDYEMIPSQLKSTFIIKPKTDKVKEESVRKSLSLEEQYSQIINKYIQNKKNVQDKGQWPGEYKVMIRYLVMLLKEKLPDDPVIYKLQKIINEKHDQNLQSAVVKIMEILQKLIFDNEDYKLRKLFNIIKHRFCLLNDFYKK